MTLRAGALFNPGHVCALSPSFAGLQLYLLHCDVNRTLGEVLSSDQQLFDISHDEQELFARCNPF